MVKPFDLNQEPYIVTFQTDGITLDGTVTLSNDANDRFLLMQEKPNYLEALSQNTAKIVLASEETYIELQSQPATDKVFVTDRSGKYFEGQINYSFTPLLAGSPASMVLTFLKFKADCNAQPCTLNPDLA